MLCPKDLEELYILYRQEFQERPGTADMALPNIRAPTSKVRARLKLGGGGAPGEKIDKGGGRGMRRNKWIRGRVVRKLGRTERDGGFSVHWDDVDVRREGTCVGG